MIVVSLISQKGGAGKSTLAMSLATIAGESAPSLLIDRDQPQATTTKWWNRRHVIEPAPAFPDLLDIGQASLTAAVRRLKSDPGFLFLDTRPAVGPSEAEAAELSDFVIVPVRTSINDVEAIAETLAILKRLDRRALIIVNAAKNERRAVDARAALSRFPVAVCPHHVSDRAAYLDAAFDGLSVTEMQGHAARVAEAELRQVWLWVMEMING